MSILGISSYLLVARKGLVNVPFCRGSAFLLDYTLKNGFNALHVITAAHVAKPHRFAPLYGSPKPFEQIGDRHVSCALLQYDDSGKRLNTIRLRFQTTEFKGKDVTELRIENERPLLKYYLEELKLPPLMPFALDRKPLSLDDEVIFCGMHVEDDHCVEDECRMTPRRVRGVCKAAFEVEPFGTMLLASCEQPITPGMSGGPVLRASDGTVLGITVAKIQKEPPNEAMRIDPNYQKLDPVVDCHRKPESFKDIPHEGAAFIPIGEFFNHMRETEV